MEDGLQGKGRLLLFVGNEGWFFLSHRLPLALAAKRAGFRVAVACPASDVSARFAELELEFYPIPMSRKGMDPLAEMATCLALIKLFRKLRPEVVHLVAVKACLLGGLAARLASVPAVVSAFTGLGFLFSASGMVPRIRRRALRGGFRYALGHPNQRVVFQNPADLDQMVQQGLVHRDRTRLIRGSGVDMLQFQAVPEPEGPVRVVLAARMLRDKGVMEFIDAARILCAQGVVVQCVLVGDPDPGNPTSIPQDTLKACAAEGIIQWVGFQQDMARVLAEAHLVCLPSYSEGVPKVLIEAAASGRAIVATDIPGCREIVEHERTGLLVPVQNPTALAQAIRQLAEDSPTRQLMGARGRVLAEQAFSLDRVIRETLDAYAEVLQPHGGIKR
jgi:glycosyltransferase involved in cell wall biosynthesis